MDNEKVQEDSYGVTFNEVIAEILRWKYIVIGIIAFCMAAAYFYTVWFIVPTYSSTATLHLLNAENEGTDSAELSTFSYLANDFVELISTKNMVQKSYEEVKDKLSKDYTVSNIKSALSVERRSNTRIIDVKITLENKEDTKILADAIASVSCRTFIESYKKDIVEIADHDGPRKASPNIQKNVTTGFVTGVFISILLLFIFKYTNERLSGAQEVEKYLGISTLATIPYNRSKNSDTRKANGK